MVLFIFEISVRMSSMLRGVKIIITLTRLISRKCTIYIITVVYFVILNVAIVTSSIKYSTTCSCVLFGINTGLSVLYGQTAQAYLLTFLPFSASFISVLLTVFLKSLFRKRQIENENERSSSADFTADCVMYMLVHLAYISIAVLKALHPQTTYNAPFCLLVVFNYSFYSILLMKSKMVGFNNKIQCFSLKTTINPTSVRVDRMISLSEISGMLDYQLKEHIKSNPVKHTALSRRWDRRFPQSTLPTVVES